MSEYSTVAEQQFDRVFDEAYLEVYAPRAGPRAGRGGGAGRRRARRRRAGGRDPRLPVRVRAPFRPARERRISVTAADRSQVLLDEARRRAGKTELELVQADYRNLPFGDDTFDAVVNLSRRSATPAARETRRRFVSSARVLRHRGKLVVETMHRDRLMRIFQARRGSGYPAATCSRKAASTRSRASTRTR